MSGDDFLCCKRLEKSAARGAWCSQNSLEIGPEPLYRWSEKIWSIKNFRNYPWDSQFQFAILFVLLLLPFEITQIFFAIEKVLFQPILSKEVFMSSVHLPQILTDADAKKRLQQFSDNVDKRFCHHCGVKLFKASGTVLIANVGNLTDKSHDSLIFGWIQNPNKKYFFFITLIWLEIQPVHHIRWNQCPHFQNYLLIGCHRLTGSLGSLSALPALINAGISFCGHPQWNSLLLLASYSL